uniref:Beta-defensin-like domain-containing protein n=1 Tax=Gopherus evgoodei TaxID=1825980 RepID=A0A8C4W568_9SAUR
NQVTYIAFRILLSLLTVETASEFAHFFNRNADFLDNLNCRNNFGFCHSGDCPPSTTLIGTCINGKINCCKWTTAP